MIATENFDKVYVESREELRNWLLENHTKSESFWLVTYKKSVPDKYVDRWTVLDELICFGWIDGIRRKLDEERTTQLISQRKLALGEKLQRQSGCFDSEGLAQNEQY